MARRSHQATSTPLHTLQLNEARWQAVRDSTYDAIISVDGEGRITLFNSTAERMFGYTADQVLGANVKMLMPLPYADEHDQYIRGYQQTGLAKAIGRVSSTRAKRKSGEVFPIELSLSEARLDNEILYTAIIRDVTERLRAEEELRELQRLTQQRQRLADIGAITANVGTQNMFESTSGKFIKQTPQVPFAGFGPAVCAWPWDTVSIEPDIQRRDQAAGSKLV